MQYRNYRVKSPISKGDLLTTSSTPCHAMKPPCVVPEIYNFCACEIRDVRTVSDFNELKEINYQNDLCRNSILGKALEPCKTTCKITALVTLQ